MCSTITTTYLLVHNLTNPIVSGNCSFTPLYTYNTSTDSTLTILPHWFDLLWRANHDSDKQRGRLFIRPNENLPSTCFSTQISKSNSSTDFTIMNLLINFIQKRNREDDKLHSKEVMYYYTIMVLNFKRLQKRVCYTYTKWGCKQDRLWISFAKLSLSLFY